MSEELDPMIEEKQNYLRQNILDRGYDGNTFVNFLMERRGEEGADVSNWSFPDLQAVVNEFIALNLPICKSTLSAPLKNILALQIASSSPSKVILPSSTFVISYPKSYISLLTTASNPK